LADGSAKDGLVAEQDRHHCQSAFAAQVDGPVGGDGCRAGPSGAVLEDLEVIRWRFVDLPDKNVRHFGVQLRERTVGKLMASEVFPGVGAPTPP
jgi:hypothetical protein